jgi:hypothetical protein
MEQSVSKTSVHAMKFISLLFFFLCVSFCAKESEAPRKVELLKNGSLETGAGGQPAGWGLLDRISAKWSDKGHPGKCLLLDTAVAQKDKKKFAGTPEQYAPSQGNGQYDVVGAHEGAWGYAPPYKVKEEDTWFILSCDCKACAVSTELFYPQILIRGFQKVTEANAGKNSSWFHEYFGNGTAYSEVFGKDSQRRASRAGDFLMVYRHSMACRISQADTWLHFEMGFKLPADRRHRPERLLFKPYACWPAGIYCFDNLSLRSATKEEAMEVNSRRPSIRNFQ